jgi:hypothetical protein
LGAGVLATDKIKILAETTMVGLYLFGGGEALVRVLLLSEKFESLHRSPQISLLNL